MVTLTLFWPCTFVSLAFMFLDGRIPVKLKTWLNRVGTSFYRRNRRSSFSGFLHRNMNDLPQYAEPPCPSLPAGPTGVEEDKGRADSHSRHQPGIPPHGRTGSLWRRVGCGQGLGPLVQAVSLGFHAPAPQDPCHQGPLTALPLPCRRGSCISCLF